MKAIPTRTRKIVIIEYSLSNTRTLASRKIRPDGCHPSSWINVSSHMKTVRTSSVYSWSGSKITGLSNS